MWPEMTYRHIVCAATRSLGGQGHDNQKPSFGTVHELDGTPVRPRDLVDHGESESGTGFAAGNVFPRKRLDQRIGTGVANTGAPIRDGHDNVAIVPASGNLYVLLSVTHPV